MIAEKTTEPEAQMHRSGTVCLLLLSNYYTTQPVGRILESPCPFIILSDHASFCLSVYQSEFCHYDLCAQWMD